MIVIACVSQHKLLAQLRRGAEPATSKFYHKLWKKVFATLAARYQAHHLQQLEDCFSDAFLLFLQKIKEPDFRAQNLMGYAYKIVYFCFRDRLKRKRWLIPTAPAELPETAFAQTADIYSTGDLFEAKEYDHLAQWFHRLSDREQKILDLQLQNFKLKEIADHLDLSHGTVRNLRSRLIRQAREVIIDG